MEGFRFLLPAPIIRSTDTGRSVEPLGPYLCELSRHRKQTLHPHTDEEWDRIKADLTRLLYTYELKDAAEIIEDSRGFDAGLRSYKYKIAERGWKQHLKADSLKVIVAKKEKWKLDDSKDTVVDEPSAPLPQPLLYARIFVITNRLRLKSRYAPYAIKTPYIEILVASAKVDIIKVEVAALNDPHFVALVLLGSGVVNNLGIRTVAMFDFDHLT